jgi:G6PDH family F420-dependent oxidoreductase
MKMGYALSSEELRPRDMVRYARRAEEVGFSFIAVSDHYHPWIDRQGESPFVWSVLGGIAAATERVTVGTAVTCPTIRIHPAIIAQAAATAADMLPGRFFLGVGSGEFLNEHILADRWPETRVRLDMLEEAVDIIRLLWRGGTRSHDGEHYVVEKARVYTLPEQLPPIYVSAFGPKAMKVAARIGDGYVGTSPDQDLVSQYGTNGGTGPKLGGVKVCWGADEQEAAKLAHALWPTMGVPGELNQELRTPAHFEQAVSKVTVEEVGGTIACGPDPERHLSAIRQYFDAGYDEVYVHQIGPDQEGFFRFYEREVLPKL